MQKTKEEKRQKKKEGKDVVDPNKPKRPASSFFLFRSKLAPFFFFFSWILKDSFFTFSLNFYLKIFKTGFCSKEARKTLMEERAGINNSTLNALISVKWKEMSDEEKQKWNLIAAESMDAYKKEMEEYNKSIAAADKKENN